MSDSYIAFHIHGHAIRPSQAARHGDESPNADHATIFSDRYTPNRIIACCSHIKRVTIFCHYKAIWARYIRDKCIRLLRASTKPIDTPGRILETRLPLIGKKQIAGFGKSTIIHTTKPFPAGAW